MDHFVEGGATLHGQEEKESRGGDLKKREGIFSEYLENIII